MTEVIGTGLHPVWVWLEGIPLHVWHERVFARIGECLGVVMEVDEEGKNKNRIDYVRIFILKDPHPSLPQTVALEVAGIRFSISVIEEDDRRRSGKMQSLEMLCRKLAWPENLVTP